jgi:hypothetical protein
MRRRINYTGRARIHAEDAAIRISKTEEGITYFTAELHLNKYDFHSDAIVVVEAYRQTTWMRFDFGKIGSIAPPKDCALAEFDVPDDIHFRVKVISPGKNRGQLLGLADKIRPSDKDKDTDRIPLLPIKPEDLGDEIWRIDITDHPRMLINSSLGDVHSFAKSPQFVTLVSPAAFRQVLTRILQDGHRDTGDYEDWQSLWLRFAVNIPGVNKIPAERDTDTEALWIDDAVNAFCRQQRTMEKFLGFWTAGGEN